MLLEIDDYKTLRDLQEKFNLCFPHLKIEFCKHRHHWQELSDPEEFFSPYLAAGLLRKIHDPGVLAIYSNQKAGEVERRFSEDFGLHVQIFFNIDGRWVQTGTTDNMSLADLHHRWKSGISRLSL